MSQRSIAVIGAGAWGKNLVRTLAGLDQLAMVCESDATRHESLAPDAGGAQFVTDPGQVMESDVEAVVIATPAQTHFELGIRALRAGKHVFIEKPMTLSVADAEVLCNEAESLNRTLMVGHLLLYQPAVTFIKNEVIDTGRIGKLVSIHQERLNLGRARSVENVLWSLGVHDVAVAGYLVESEPLSVKCAGTAFLNPGIEDDVYLHTNFRSGVSSHLHCSWLWPARSRRTIVIGSEAMCVYDELEQKVTLRKARIESSLAQFDEGEELIFEGAGEPLKLEMEHFISSFKGGTSPISDGRSALDVIRVMERATQDLKS